MANQESEDKKKFMFLHGTRTTDTCGSEDDKLSESRRRFNRSRQISFVWNQGFHRMDNIKRRQSLMDPRELLRRREFSGKRFFGETEEYTEAKVTRETTLKHRIIRRHSFENIDTDQKQYIMSRASFATRYHPDAGEDSECTSNTDLSSSSSGDSCSQEQKKNVVYRVSFADPERVEAIQALLSKTKQSIVVHQRPQLDDPHHEKFETRVNSAIRIYHTSSDDTQYRKSADIGESSENKSLNPSREESSAADQTKDSESSIIAQRISSVIKEETEPEQPQASSTWTPPGLHTDKRCATDEKTSLEIKIESQSKPSVEAEPCIDASNQGSFNFSLAPLCELL